MNTERAQALAEMAACTENGKVALIESGMDCDCVRYSGRVHIVDATEEAVEELYDYVYKWADGPVSLAFCKPSVAKQVRYTSRDLALEAFEDGHPHSIHG